MKELEIKIAQFFSNPKVKTRSGVPHNVNSFQRDANGNITGIVGTITEKVKANDGTESELKTEMLWSSTGQAYCNKPMVFDLVEELPISELGK